MLFDSVIQIHRIQSTQIVEMEKLFLFNHKELKLTEISALKRTQITVNSRNLELVSFVERRVPRFVKNNKFALC